MLEERERNNEYLDAIDLHGRTLLYYASGYGSIEQVEKLIAAGCDVNALDDNWDSPLKMAVACNDAEVVEKFISSRAIINPIDQDPRDPPNHRLVML